MGGRCAPPLRSPGLCGPATGRCRSRPSRGARGARRVAPSGLLSYINGVRFVWDPRKAKANLKKHGVSFDEASTAFQDELGAYFPDSLHEDRFILIGYSRRERLLYVVHAEVASNTVRIISARKATNHERTRYENG